MVKKNICDNSLFRQVVFLPCRLNGELHDDCSSGTPTGGGRLWVGERDAAGPPLHHGGEWAPQLTKHPG